jgi:protease-4
LIDDRVLYLPYQAIEFGLVDTIARWSDVDKVIDQLLGKNLRAIGRTALFDNALPPQFWGGDPEIAVVYALGDCAMDRGIRARWLSRKLESLARDNTIKAVVFRVDSPGGDGMASDLVAEALKKCAARKPVIVSQGQVAGSGGYWISMYGDKILAGPNTVTGSIGVIGGWIWDKEMSKKLGMSYDKVQRGAHADIFKGVRLPILNITVPGRNLTDDERTIVEDLIMEMYDEFVAKVAKGRNMTVERVREIGEGRFYSGLDGKEVGLVDDIGGLMMAIEIAKEQAGIAKEQRVKLIEIPEHLGMFPFKRPNAVLPFGSMDMPQDSVIEYIKMLNESPHKALPMLPPGYYPTAE